MAAVDGCTHQTVFRGLCAVCGSVVVDDKRQRFNVAHNTKGVYVDEEEAKRLQKEAATNYHKTKRLPLILDLDLTIIQACVEKDTIEEWKADPSNPNYPALSDPLTLTTFTLAEAGAHTYYVKLRPGGRKFLDSVSKLYELHIYTMGTEPYARAVAHFLDPTGVVFADRILSRDTSGSNMVKSIDRLFPYGHEMVVVVDDRADVWNHLDNVLKVMPFDFFKSVGDVNAPMIAAAQQLENIDKVAYTALQFSALPRIQPFVFALQGENPSEKLSGLTDTDRNTVAEAAADQAGDDDKARESRIRHAVEAVEDENLTRLESAKPLKRAAMSLQKSTKDSSSSSSNSNNSNSNGNGTPNGSRHPSVEPAILVEDDQELKYVQKALSIVHDTYFRLYDAGYMPNVPNIMRAMRKTVFAGCSILFSSVIPITQKQPELHEMYRLAEEFGATIVRDLPPPSLGFKGITHVVAGKACLRREGVGTDKVIRAMKAGVPVVRVDWLTKSAFRWRREPIQHYLHDTKAPLRDLSPSSKPLYLSEDELVAQGAVNTNSSIDIALEVPNTLKNALWDVDGAAIDISAMDAELQAALDAETTTEDESSEAESNGAEVHSREQSVANGNESNDDWEDDFDAAFKETIASTKRPASLHSDSDHEQRGGL
ncbi:hypothetical protein SmJEL517_g00288 [Synchytrium microbalum]|uniref:RNA polymerase II subunit A C-terminal domain phosphatase n=1 Tax=Synchytrium microbalum TaxID=1806994 RepID=A0A507CFL0_9FUNG|nr:uncharacterized protein SmJEL517_g00288 [Synchytrium microbalum]TPX38281.1 hypothetical protein SmJEL517_g00288 [Synchytrium microbalum]